MTSEEDAELQALMVAAQAGDQAAYERLLREIATRLRRFALARIRDTALGEDIVQDCLMTVHRARHTYDPNRPFGPWLFAIAECRLIDALRREGRHSKRLISDDEALATYPDQSPAVSDTESQSVLADELRRALAELPSAQREVVQLMKVDGLSVREVAGATGLSEGNVRVIAHRAYKSLRDRLSGWRL
jgi:RNA polymerase sigma-70 factor (ECF subfamily)